MELKLRLMDYTLEDEGYTVIETASPDMLIKAAGAYICESNAMCSELYVEQWDPKYKKWISITAATDTLNSMISKLMKKYKRLTKQEGSDQL